MRCSPFKAQFFSFSIAFAALLQIASAEHVGDQPHHPVPAASTQCLQLVAPLNISNHDKHLYLNGKLVRLKGLSWFGFETQNNVFHGLWARDYGDLLDFVSNNSFNAMRVPFYLELVLNDAQPDSINFYNMNADLKNLSSLQVLDKVVAAAAERGILIMFDMHSFKGGTFMEDGLWYDAVHPEVAVLKGWDALLDRYQSQWNVVAFDLKNEPFKTTWNTNNEATDWNEAAARIGNHILSRRPNSLIFVEGTAQSPACTNACFWGEDFQGVHSADVELTDMSKLVYSPHCYGPSVAYQDYFQTNDFPNNMPAIWEKHYGFLPEKTNRGFVIGEWGGSSSGANGVWLQAYTKWLLQKDNTDQFFWCLNPDSGDTGGLLGYDWKTPDSSKLDLLKNLVPSPTNFKPSNNQLCLE